MIGVIILKVNIGLILAFYVKPRMIKTVLLIIIVEIAAREFCSSVLRLIRKIKCSISLRQRHITIKSAGYHRILTTIQFFRQDFTTAVSLHPALIPGQVTAKVDLLAQTIICTCIKIVILRMINLLQVTYTGKGLITL